MKPHARVFPEKIQCDCSFAATRASDSAFRDTGFSVFLPNLPPVFRIKLADMLAGVSFDVPVATPQIKLSMTNSAASTVQTEYDCCGFTIRSDEVEIVRAVCKRCPLFFCPKF